MSIFYTEQEIQNLGLNPVGKIKEEDENKSSIFFTEEDRAHKYYYQMSKYRSMDFYVHLVPGVQNKKRGWYVILKGMK